MVGRAENSARLLEQILKRCLQLHEENFSLGWNWVVSLYEKLFHTTDISFGRGGGMGVQGVVAILSVASRLKMGLTLVVWISRGSCVALPTFTWFSIVSVQCKLQAAGCELKVHTHTKGLVLATSHLGYKQLQNCRDSLLKNGFPSKNALLKANGKLKDISTPPPPLLLSMLLLVTLNATSKSITTLIWREGGKCVLTIRRFEMTRKICDCLKSFCNYLYQGPILSV